MLPRFCIEAASSFHIGFIIFPSLSPETGPQRQRPSAPNRQCATPAPRTTHSPRSTGRARFATHGRATDNGRPRGSISLFRSCSLCRLASRYSFAPTLPALRGADHIGSCPRLSPHGKADSGGSPLGGKQDDGQRQLPVSRSSQRQLWRAERRKFEPHKRRREEWRAARQDVQSIRHILEDAVLSGAARARCPAYPLPTRWRSRHGSTLDHSRTKACHA
ncbi:hypothetical protein C8R44DRAFT_885020 [Mycena epipterygia]|nr:hypothetical protein C8R44DRAFT_885020 [Mycena epipterygia]